MLNIIALQGRLVADPELRHTAQGTNVCRFRVAVDRSYVGQDQQRQADFIDVVAWRGAAEFVCKYFQKGSMIAIDGSIQTRQYQDKNGNNRQAVEVVADHLHFCGPARSVDAVPQNGSPAGASAADGDFSLLDDSEDLPF